MTPLSKAAAAVELVEGAGYTHSMAASLLGLGRATVSEIIEGQSGWAERKIQSVFTQYRLEQKGKFEHAMTRLTEKLLVQAEKNLDKASTYQCVGSAGLLFDKIRLLQGQPTEITASVSIQAVGSLDKLAQMLGHSLVDQAPGGNSGGNSPTEPDPK